MNAPVPPPVRPGFDVEDLDRMARRYARLSSELAEQKIAAHAADAVATRRIDDALFWQRVKFRSRLFRAIGCT